MEGKIGLSLEPPDSKLPPWGGATWSLDVHHVLWPVPASSFSQRRQVYIGVFAIYSIELQYILLDIVTRFLLYYCNNSI